LVCTGGLNISRVGQRAASAKKELTSLSSQPRRGIDARSLAATPVQQTFTVRRIDPSNPGEGRGGYERSGRGRAGAVVGGRGGRGGGVGSERRGRGRKSVQGGRKPKGRRAKPIADDDEPPYNLEELVYIEGSRGGWPTPHAPNTNLESLARDLPPVISSMRGAVQTAVYKMQVGTDSTGGNHTHAADHLHNLKKGNGTMFESAEAKAVTQAFLDEKGEQTAWELGLPYKPVPIPTLPPSERAILSKTWIAGQHEKPKPAKAGDGDVLGKLEQYSRLNETYLSQDRRKFEEKLRSLIPGL
jgi:hypothetical protein